MKQAVHDRLTGDTQLMALLPGGLHTTAEISRQATPTAFDANSEIMPCALLKLGSVIPAGPYETSAQQTIEVFFYHPSGFTALSAVIDRVYQLLHRQRLEPSSGTCWGIQHDNDTPEDEDPALGVPMRRSRYVAFIRR